MSIPLRWSPLPTGKVYDIIVAKEFLLPTDRVLLIDDFLANGSALQGLINLVRDAGATLVGAGHLRGKGVSARRRPDPQHGRPVESLARVKSMSEENGITFC